MRHSRITIVLFAGLMLWLFASHSFAAWETIAAGSRLCGSDGQVCLNGRIAMERNEKVIVIDGRFASLPGAGTVTFEFYGVNPLDERVYFAKSVVVGERNNQLVSLKFGPPHSNQTQWTLENIRFDAAN